MKELVLRFMSAHVRNHTGAPLRQWAPEEVIDSFLLLAPPTINFPAWCSSLNVGAAPAPESSEPTTAEMEAANESAVATLRAVAVDTDGAFTVEERK